LSKEIILKSLILKNFKGIKSLSVNFNRITNISGDNATGKTTIFDAFTWLLFDKDSQDRSNFEIKTLGTDGQPIHNLEHQVTGTLSIDGRTIILSKLFREKWIKKRGEAEQEFSGHETLYYINDVPVKKSEYQDTINNLIDESIFKLITNPLYFSNNMKWQDRRKALMDIIGDVSNETVINYKRDLGPLEALLEDKDIDTLKKSISARKKKLNDDIKAIPYRIDECNNSIIECNFDTLDARRRVILDDIKRIEDKLLDKSKVNEDFLQEKDKLYKLQSRIKDIEHEAGQSQGDGLYKLKTELSELNHKIQSLEFQRRGLVESKDRVLKSISESNQVIEKLRQEWFDIDKKHMTFDAATVCPTCNRPFSEEEIEHNRQEITENYNLQKAKTLSQITADGQTEKAKLDKLQEDAKRIEDELGEVTKSIITITGQADLLKAKIDNYQPEDIQIVLSKNTEYQELKAQANITEKALQYPTIANDMADLKAQKVQLQGELEEINKKLAAREQNEKLRARIRELRYEEKNLAQQIADLEKQEYLTEEFIKTKVELLEGSINKRFQYVTFKLFSEQVNGGISECCEALVNGVPYSNANSAAQINAGLDIINTLSEYYGVTAPIFVDNRESVNELIQTEAQIINLIVSKDKTLRIESEEMRI
jgi:DNA repair exonuclease SbcCD ATPase subunit